MKSKRTGVETGPMFLRTTSAPHTSPCKASLPTVQDNPLTEQRKEIIHLLLFITIQNLSQETLTAPPSDLARAGAGGLLKNIDKARNPKSQGEAGGAKSCIRPGCSLRVKIYSGGQQPRCRHGWHLQGGRNRLHGSLPVLAAVDNRLFHS